MHRRTLTLSALTPGLLVSLAGAASAQTPGPALPPSVARGIASTWPAGALFRGSSLDEIRLKGIGDQSNPPGAWAPPSTPWDEADFSMSALMAAIGSQFGTSVDFDAISTGNGIIPTPIINGAPNIDGSWLALALTIADDDNGAAGSLFRDAHDATGHAGADVVTYYLSESDGVLPLLAGTATLETNRSHFGLDPAGTDDLSGLDYGLGLRTLNPRIPEMRFFNERYHLYFSVTKEWADSKSGMPFAVDHTGAAHDANGTDIYVMRWDRNVDAWAGPFIYAKGDTVGFDRATGDLDALELDRRANVVIVSGRIWHGQNPASTYGAGNIVGPEDQLMIVELVEVPLQSIAAGLEEEDFTQAGAELPRALRDTSTDEDTVSEKAGVGVGDDPADDPDDIDGACGFDPDAGNFAPEVGTPVWHDTTWGPRPLGLSLSLSEGATIASDKYEVQVTGWGGTTPSLMSVVLFRHDGVVNWGSNPGSLNWTPVGALTRMQWEDEVSFSIDVDSGSSAAESSFQVIVYNTTTRVAIGSSWVLAVSR